MTLSENDKSLLRTNRREIRTSLGETIGELMNPNQDFNLMVTQLDQIDLIKNSVGHATRANIQNQILKDSPDYPDILALMRDRDADRKKIAREIKKALKKEGYGTGDITALRDKELAMNPTYQMFDIAKRETEKVLASMLQTRPIWTKYLLEVTGISVLTGSKLLQYVDDVTRFNQPSKLIKYCGLAVKEDGGPQVMRRGKQGGYKPKLKALLLGVIGNNFIKSNSEYRRIYDERKEYTMENRPEWGKHPKGKDKLYMAHYHKDARRVMVKRFVHEFWDNGWLLSGVQPPSKPYAVAILGHDMENKVVPVNSDRGLIYRWNDGGVQDETGRILYSWVEWREYVDSLTNPNNM